MSIAFAVSTIPERAEACAELLTRFTSHTPRVYVDELHTGGSWHNYRRALLDAGAAGEDWLVSVDDDALLCVDFEAQVARALAACPWEFASFYFSNRHVVAAARESGASWVSTLRVVHGICFAIRPRVAREAIEVAERHIRPDYYSGDQRLQVWLIKTGRRNYISLPSLVDHRPDMESRIKPGFANAVHGAAWFERDVSSVRWTSDAWLDQRGTAMRALRILQQRGALRVPAMSKSELQRSRLLDRERIKDGLQRAVADVAEAYAAGGMRAVDELTGRTGDGTEVVR